MNAPHPAEHFTLAEGEQKISFEADSRLSDSGTFTILKEDHTLGNLLCMSILRDKRVLFAGYRLPHPLENRMVVKIRCQSAISPVDVISDSLTALNTELSGLTDQFKRAVHAHSQRQSMDIL